MPWNDVATPEDDKFHPRNDNPWWNESAYISFTIPEHDLMGMVYFWFRPNMGYCVGGPAIWDPSGDDIYNCRHWAHDSVLPIPSGAEMFDFTMENGLTLRTVELQREYEISYTGPGCRLDLKYTANAQPYYMRLADGQINNGITDWVKDSPGQLAIGHYEQAGRVQGTLTLGDETFEVNSPSLRDHTWGPRPMMSHMHPMRGGYPFAMADDGSMFSLYATTDLAPENDPIVGTTERVVSGYYVKDGVQGELVAGTRRCERGDDGRPGDHRRSRQPRPDVACRRSHAHLARAALFQPSAGVVEPCRLGVRRSPRRG